MYRQNNNDACQVQVLVVIYKRNLLALLLRYSILSSLRNAMVDDLAKYTVTWF